MSDARRQMSELIEAVKRRPIFPLASPRCRRLKRVRFAEYLGLCPFHSEKTPSFRINDKKCTFRCYGCGAHGSIIDFLMLYDGLDFMGAVKAAAAFYGIIEGQVPKVSARPAPAPERDERRLQHEITASREIWRSGVAAMDTPVEIYLRKHRRIDIGALPGGIIPPTLRFGAEVEYWHERKCLGKFPAMLAPLQALNGEQMGLHATYLDPRDFSKLRLPHPEDRAEILPAKKMRGMAWACAIRLAPAAATMAVSEGIENGLCGMMCGTPGVWAAASLNNLAGRGIGTGEAHPRRKDKRLPAIYPDFREPGFDFPPETREILLLCENDSKDQESADCLFERAGRRLSHSQLVAAGAPRLIKKFMPDPGCDLNDMVIAGKMGRRLAHV